MLRRKLFVFVLLVPLVGCTDANLKKIAQELDVTAKTVATLQTTVIDANTKKLISEADTRTILTLCIQVSQAGQQATAATRAINALGPADRTQLTAILAPVITSVGNVASQTIAISNPQTAETVKTLVLTLQTTLNSINLVVAGGA